MAFNENIADMKFYEDKLNSAIVQHLTPWAYRQGADISFGGQWHKSAIINFIEEQPYVHFIKNFEMYHKVDIDSEDSAINFQDTEVVVPTTARSILVSH
ncbi:MAG: hypothetical protein GWN61_23325, partial [candidate division Zixibacteria bacterium]|nr:hypothetical protein [candidate division Zixibacteria bacterium]NIV09023.1 hypothetical protein [candidate division Zixibacteria bacterium]